MKLCKQLAMALTAQLMHWPLQHLKSQQAPACELA